MRPKLLKDELFEVVVDNEQVKYYMEQMAGRIVDHMRKNLHNRKLNMSIRIAAPSENKHIYSKPQQYQVMSQKNPALQKLKEAFGLELV